MQYAQVNSNNLENRQAVRAVLRQGLDQAAISAHLFEEKNNKLFSRCVLELDTLKQMIAASPLDKVSRTDMLDKADQVFEAFVPIP